MIKTRRSSPEQGVGPLPVAKGGLTPLHGYFPLSNPQDNYVAD